MVVVWKRELAGIRRRSVTSNRRHRNLDKVHPLPGSTLTLTVVVCHPCRWDYWRLKNDNTTEFLCVPDEFAGQRGNLNYLSHACIVDFLCGHGDWSSSSCTNVGSIPLLPFRTFGLFMPWLVAPEAHDGSGIIATIITSSSTMFLGNSRLGGTLWLGITVTKIGGSQRIGIQSC